MSWPRLQRLLDVHSDDARPLAWSAAQFALLMAALYVVRPLRDELGIRSGVENMQWLFSGTFGAMLLLVPLYGWAVSRRPRRVVMPWVFICIAVTLVLARVVSAGLGEASQPIFAAVLFVWISAFNLFAVSVFWSLAVDVFSPESSRRNFGLISAGGTIGALCGPLLAAAGAHWLVPDDLLLLCAGLLLGVAVAARGFERATRRAGDEASHKGLGGGVVEGFALLATQPRLRALCGYLLCMTWVSTVLYFEQSRVVAAASLDSAERTTIFAGLDLAVNASAIVIQLLFTGRVLGKLGLAVVLVALPVVSGAALIGISVAPTLGVVLVAQAVRRATNFALARPAREVLYTGVDRVSRFKGKNVVDTVVYRGGDMIAGWAFAGLEFAGVGLGAIAWLATPVVGIWAWLGVRLGRASESPDSGENAVASAHAALGDARHRNGP